ncbi:MAG: PulJ/GspJ family protein [Planctomycetota bacterium]
MRFVGHLCGERQPLHRRYGGESPSGFTLLEVIVASILAGMLMVALVGLLRGFAQQRRYAETLTKLHPPAGLLVSQMRRDLLSARAWQVVPGGLRFIGTMGSGFGPGAPVGRLAEVHYRIVADDAGPRLLRSELPLGEAAGRGPRDELLWSGAAAVELVVLQDSAETSRTASAVQVPGMQPMPPQVRCVVRGVEGSTIADFIVLHHWEGN